MIVGVSRIDLHIPQARSLKDKRQVVKSLVHRIAHRFNVSVSEIDGHDLWQTGTIAVAHVASSQTDSDRLLRSVTAYAEGISGGEIVRATYSYYNPDKDD